ncbi:hypothetical protein, variant [Aphanomyces astaci]|uniref:Tudor domain-containing protein n=1 Tax=Aphanomyces astaci TaxID=112090 RepID=W4GXI1_APHAT|nr:hypothetical protein, variant [Aphanomyces astaci]ETV84435.1 hypothetical protein, variant [Aphanomyces astaci]|eukprot:XP_009826127.1 hypothetical protein, variant [Aphanomyces astaci]
MNVWQWIATAIVVLVGGWAYVNSKTSSSTTGAASSLKRKPKKKSKKKKPGLDASLNTNVANQGKDDSSNGDEADNASSKDPPTITDYFDESESESDDGLSAGKVLSQKHFGMAMLGGSRKLRPTAPELQLQEGQRVVARFKQQSEWFPGTVTKVQRGNLYIITYDDGEVESKVPIQYIRVTNESSGDTGGNLDDDGAAEDGSDSESSEDAVDNEWEVVSTKEYKKRPVVRAAVSDAVAHPSGLTKKQRESRRKKEKLKEQKELVRAQAQVRVTCTI